MRDWIALVLLLGSCAFGAVGIINWIITSEEGTIKPNPLSLGTLLTTLVLLCLSFYASSYPRPILLYLRKFGESSSNTPFIQAAKQQVFRDYRIVALHDESSNPYIPDDFAGCVISLVLLTLWGITIDRTTGWISTWLGFLCILIPFAAKFLSLLFEDVWSKRHSLSIRSDQDLVDVVERVRRWSDRSNWLIVQRASNIAVAESQWRDAVVKIAHVAQVVLIDISRIAPGVTWEAGLSLLHFPEKTIFLARDRAAAEANIAKIAREAPGSVNIKIVIIGDEPAEAKKSIRELRWLLS